MKKKVAIVLIILMLCSCSGCTGKGHNAPTPEPHQTAAPETAMPTTVPTDGPVSTPEPTDTPAPTEDPTPARALALAAEHGLTKDDLHGEYELFIRFSETVECNSALGKYKEFVYLIFPVAADASAYMDLDYFFNMLSELSFNECELESGIAGMYTAGVNRVDISTSIEPYDSYHTAEVVFHELMHFVDFNVSNEYPALYLLNGKRLTPYEIDGLSQEEQDALVICYDPDVVTEGGAEYFTAKYFAGAVRAYFIPAQFLAGVEYIFGEEKLDELFFSRDSAAVLAELFLGAGYTKEKYYSAWQTLNWLTSSVYHDEPSVYIAPEDMLIDFYEHERGDGWQTDEGFLFILKAINDVVGDGYLRSRHAEFLRGVEFHTWAQCDAFLEALYHELPFQPELRYALPTPVIRGGRLMLGSFAEWTDPETQQRIRGTVTVDYDLAAEALLGYETIDMDAVTARYFG